MPQGPSFIITEKGDGLSFGILDPSGLSNQSRGLIGQFLGFLNFQVIGDNENVGTILWSSQKGKMRHESDAVLYRTYPLLYQNIWYFSARKLIFTL